MDQNQNTEFCDLPLQEIEAHLNNPAFGYYDQEIREKFFNVFFNKKWRHDVAVLAMTKYNVNPFYGGKRIFYLIMLIQSHPISCGEFLKILPMLCDSTNNNTNISILEWNITNILPYNMVHACILNPLHQTFQLSESRQRVHKAIHCFQKAQFHSLFHHVKQNKHKNEHHNEHHNAIAYFYYHPLFDHHLITHLIDDY